MPNMSPVESQPAPQMHSAGLKRIRLIRPKTSSRDDETAEEVPKGNKPDPRGPIAAWLAQLGKSAANLLTAHVVDTSGKWPTSMWPESASRDAQLVDLAQTAVSSKRYLTLPHNDGSDQRLIAVPLVLAGMPHCAVVARFAAAAGSSPAADLKVLMQASASLRLLLESNASEVKPASPTMPDAAQREALDLVAAALQQPDLRTAATAVVNQLATLLRADRVSLGLQEQTLLLIAVSRSTASDTATVWSECVCQAMQESMRQGVRLTLPARDAADTRELGAHRALQREVRCEALTTVPFAHGAKFVGAVTFEWSRAAPGDTATFERCESLVMLVGPILATLSRAELKVMPRLRSAARQAAKRWFGPRRPILKLTVLGVALLLIAAGILTTTHRVTGNAVLRGSVQRMVLAPVDGFIASTTVRPGDVVAADAVLATLDDQALSLEVAKWQAEYNRLMNEYREAMSKLDSAKVTVLRAEMDRAAAEYELAEDNFARATIRTPIAGVLVSGDLSQSIGAPVQRGQTLFELAPLDGYRVSVRIAESDVGRVMVGQRGRLVLQALPDEGLDIVVDRVTPVSEVIDGRNQFEVEARLLRASPVLRPGMQGVAKLEVGRARWLWLWTHGAIDWLRLKLWAWGLTP